MENTWKMTFTLRTLCVLCLLHCIDAELEAGIWKFNVTKDSTVFAVSKAMFNNTYVGLKAHCSESTSQPIKMRWVLRYSECENAFADIKNTFLDKILFSPKGSFVEPLEDLLRFQESEVTVTTCEDLHSFKDESAAMIQCFTTDKNSTVSHCKVYSTVPTTTLQPAAEEDKTNGKEDGKNDNSETQKQTVSVSSQSSVSAKKVSQSATSKTNASTPSTKQSVAPKSRRKRGVLQLFERAVDNSSVKPTAKTKKGEKNHAKEPENVVTRTWQDGRYLFVFAFTFDEKVDSPLSIEVTVTFTNKKGFLSASEQPLLIFYAVMCAAYTIMAFVWLLMMACQWKDILRIQFWICGVILLGLLEKAVFYSEYHHMNMTGYSSAAVLVFAEIVSCLKRTVARMLIIIVSMGFGITKPRLGPQLHRVIGVGGLYFLLSSIEACLRVQGSRQQAIVSAIPLAVLDAVICYWIFTNLVDTTRTLRLRRNLVKLWLYRHFTNALIFCIIAALIFVIWSTKVHKLAECIKKWKELWLDEAYWHVLFYIILVVIIILWRPTVNNQRYAYSPLTDTLDDDDESKEPMIPDSFEGMKMRSVNRPEMPASTKIEDDLKWVEDNIPASVADAALAAFDDSDEEIVTSIERSKME